MPVCPLCKASFEGGAKRCPVDGSDLVESEDPIIGRTFAGRYLVVAPIARGGMGLVYRARHEVVGRDVAIKFLAPSLASQPRNRVRFLREAKAANRINHENIIDITDYGETPDGLVFLVMEYLEGVVLGEALASGPFSVERTLRISLQCARALARAHELGVVHRDIKPDNIFLLPGGDGNDFVKLLDFGLAKMKGELRLTATGSVFGTPEYIAPEQARGQNIGPSADLYSLGCVMFEMLTGRLPFEGTSVASLVRQHLQELPPRPSDFCPTIPLEVESLVLTLLEKSPEKRHRDAHHLSEALRGLLRMLEIDTARPPPPVRRGAGARPISGVVHAEDMWVQRVALLARLTGQAYPDCVPVWLEDAMNELKNRAKALSALRRTRDSDAREAAERERSVREVRLQIGRAIDELASDASQAGRQEEATRARLAEVERGLAEAGVRFANRCAPWTALQVTPASLTPEVASGFIELGKQAHEWRAQWDQAEVIRAELRAHRRQREDLDFQIAQLKGRLATLSAATEMDLRGLRDETAGLQDKMQAQIDQLVRAADPVVRHLFQWPEFREALLNAPRDSTRHLESGRR